MRIIITESQHSLLRRLDLFGTYLDESLFYNDPCEYSRYEQYKRVVINETLGVIIAREQLNNVFNRIDDVDNFRDNILIPLFEDRIKEHYHSFDGKC
jgi:hypothetical protein